MYIYICIYLFIYIPQFSPVFYSALIILFITYNAAPPVARTQPCLAQPPWRGRSLSKA